MRAPVIVLVLPTAQFNRELGGCSKRRPAVELLLVGAVAPLDLAVHFGTPRRDVAMGNAQVAQMPGEVGSEFTPVVGLDTLDGHRQPVPDFVDKRDRAV